MNNENIREAARLIGFALHNPPVSPMQRKGAAYRELINSYHTSGKFSETVNTICEGLGLKVLDANSYGLFIAAVDSDSPFRAKLSSIHYSSLKQPELRQIFGLALTAIAATYYQSSATFLEESAPSATVHQVRDELLNIAEIRQKEIENGSESSSIDEACEEILKLPITASTEKGGQRNNTLTRLIMNAFKHLENEGFVKRRDENEYTAYSKFRIHMREFMANEAYKAVTSILERQKLETIRELDKDHA